MVGVTKKSNKTPARKPHAKVDKVDGNSPKPGRIDAGAEAVFLQALYDGFTVGKACAQIGISRAGIYKHRKNNPPFGEEWDNAQRLGHKERCDVIRSTIWERAVDGYQETEVRQWKGRDGETRTTTKVIKRVDNTLLIRLAEQHMPKEFRANVKVDAEVGPTDELAKLIDRIQSSAEAGLASLVKP